LVGLERHDVGAGLDDLDRFDALALVGADVDVDPGQAIGDEAEREELRLVRDGAQAAALLVKSVARLLQEIEVTLDGADQLAYRRMHEHLLRLGFRRRLKAG
jgi:hypothetical protein